MMDSREPVAPKFWGASILVLIVVFAFCVRDVTANPWVYISVGAALFIISFLLPTGASRGGGAVFYQGGSGMEIIGKWDESKIQTAIHSTFVTQGEGAARSLISGIISRFVDRQNSRTYMERTAFMNTQVAFVESWVRLQVAGREAARTERKEDHKDNELTLREKGLGHDLELSDLRHELEKEKLQEQIAETRHKREAIGKEPPAPPPAPIPVPGPTAAERRESQKAELHSREKIVREQIEQTKHDAALDEELRQRKLNGLYEKLTEIQDALIALL